MQLFPGYAGAQRATTGGGLDGPQARAPVYHMLLRGEPFHEESVATYDERRQEREIRQFARRAKKLGYTLTEAAPSPTEAMTRATSREGFLGGHVGRRV